MGFYSFIHRVLYRINPDRAHRLMLSVMKTGVLSREAAAYPPMPVTVFGKTLPNPIGIAAGFDTQAEVISALFGLGFGFVEVGPIDPASETFWRNIRQWRAFGRGGVVGVRLRAEDMNADLCDRLQGLADFITLENPPPELVQAWPYPIPWGNAYISPDAVTSADEARLGLQADAPLVQVSGPWLVRQGPDGVICLLRALV